MWYADPEPVGPIQLVLVAESVLVAIAAAAKLDPATRACTRIVSTAGDLTEAGQHKLIRLIREAQREWVRAGGDKLVLVDASNLGGWGTTVWGDSLNQVAASTDARYERWAPEGYKNWHEVIIAERRAQEAASAEKARLADPASEQDTLETYDGPSPRGRGR